MAQYWYSIKDSYYEKIGIKEEESDKASIGFVDYNNLHYEGDYTGEINDEMLSVIIKYPAIINAIGYEFVDKDGIVFKSSQPDKGGHAMTITGLTSNGNYIISSWGGNYILKADSIAANNFTIIDYNENYLDFENGSEYNHWVSEIVPTRKN